jgi:diguanylate cyclase (GGDEF)-like protein
VQGTNRAGIWSPHEIRLPIVVLPAFYQTAGFRFGMVLLALGLIYGAVRLRVRRLEARSQELERVVRERTLSLAEKNRELERAYVQIEDASLTDALTGLRNRRFLEGAIEGDLAVAARRHAEGAKPDGADLVFLLLDLDHFKSVNDIHGHAAGDAVLTQTAALLRSTFREADYLVRWGGEEFLVVVRFCDRRDGPELAEKLRAAMEGHAFRLPDGSRLPRTCSIGFAAYPFSPARPKAVGWEKIVDVADLGLYAAKRNGRNGWVGIDSGGWDGELGDPEEILRRFREDPAGAVAKREIRVYAPAGKGPDLRWG